MSDPNNVIDLTKRRHAHDDPGIDPDTVLEGELIDGPPDEDGEEYDDYPYTVWEHLAFVAAGVVVVVRNGWRSYTLAEYTEEIQAAKALGAHEIAGEWETKRESRRADRSARLWAWIELPGRALLHWKEIGIGMIALAAVPGIIYAIATRDAKNAADPALALCDGTLAAWDATINAAPWILGAGLLASGFLLWRTGMHAAEDGQIGWIPAALEADSDRNLVVTADSIVLALQHLPIPALKKAFKDGWVPPLSLPPVREGRGYHAVIGLPLGVTAEMVADQRPVLARNLHRAEIETWPADAEKSGTGSAGFLDVWIADPGALSRPAPEYPLLHDGTADVFTGVPAGVSPRGDAIYVPIIGNNFVAGGQMGQGKSNACRVIMLGAALDPLAELDVFVFAANGDFDAYRPRLARYHRGIDDETAYAALARLHELYAEVARREARLAELGAKKVTRALAEKHPDLRPIVSLYSECHELFGHAEVGEEAGELACKTAKRARKTAIVLGFDTQSSRKEAIPPKLVELVSVNACFYVKTWRSNDGFLGDGCFQAGIRATELRPGRDRGTSLIIGVSDAPFELLKWYFVEVNDDTGFDAASDVIARAVKNLAPGTVVNAPVKAVEERNLLDDIDAVLGSKRVTTADLASLLRDHAPDWPAYRMPGTRLAALLKGELKETKIRVITTTNGVVEVDPGAFRRALSALSTLDLDEE